MSVISTGKSKTVSRYTVQKGCSVYLVFSPSQKQGLIDCFLCVKILIYTILCRKERSDRILKIDKTVRKETGYIAAGTLILSVLMQAIFLVIGRWDYTVLLGNILGAIGAVGNFFFMGLTVQSALTKEEKDAKVKMKASQMLRMFLLFIIALSGAVLPCFQIWAVLISLFFPRIAIMCRSISLGKAQDGGGDRSE